MKGSFVFNLYQIVTSAQNGQALDNLASAHGLTRAEADRVVQALLPALSTAFTAKVGQPGGLQELAAATSDAQHRQAFVDPATATDDATRGKANDVVNSIFGNSAVVQQVIQQVAVFTGLPAATIEQMLPVIVSLILGGVGSFMHNQNLGEILGQMAGGLGGLFGQAGGVPGQAGTGGFGNMLGNIFGSFMGGATPNAGQPGTLPPAVAAGLDMFGKMFQHGVANTAGAPADLAAQINEILSGKKA